MRVTFGPPPIIRCTPSPYEASGVNVSNKGGGGGDTREPGNTPQNRPGYEPETFSLISIWMFNLSKLFSIFFNALKTDSQFLSIHAMNPQCLTSNQSSTVSLVHQ